MRAQPPTRGRGSPVADAWAQLVRRFMLSRRDTFFLAAAEVGLRPTDLKAMFTLEDGPLPMGELAESLTCDPSTVTAVVDRLEQLGFAERQPSTLDRRVKTVALTSEGLRSWQALMAKFLEPPEELLALSLVDQRRFSEIVRTALGG